MADGLEEGDEPRRKKPFRISHLPSTSDPFSLAQKEKGTFLFRTDEAAKSGGQAPQSSSVSRDQAEATEICAHDSEVNTAGSNMPTASKDTPATISTDSNVHSSPRREECHEAPPATSATVSSAVKVGSSEMEQRGALAAGAASVSVPRQRMSRNSILVNPCQQGNPVLKYIRNVPWEYDSAIIPDYVLGQTSCAHFLSIHYHLLHPNYIYQRLKRLGRNFTLRVLLVLVDVKDSKVSIQQLTKVALLAECTLILAWSSAEAARYLETYKAYENKPPDLLKERVGGDYMSRLTDCLTTVRSINKTDVVTLSSNFKSLDKIMEATPERLALCPGFGQRKAHQLHKLFRQSFFLNKQHAARVASNFSSRIGTASEQAEKEDLVDLAGVEVAELLQETNVDDMFDDVEDGHPLDEEL